jgi:two-component system, NtrC family, sensor kinase
MNDAANDTQQTIADLQRRLDESFAQQAAIAEVMRLINASLGDLDPVFDAIVEKAMRFCDAGVGGLWLVEDDLARVAATRKLPGAYMEFLTRRPVLRAEAFGPGINDRPAVHIADLAATESYRRRIPMTVASVELGGIRTYLAVPLRDGNALEGVLSLCRKEVRQFTDRELGLVQTFADQAVIAIKNARLFDDVQARTRDLSQSLDDLRTAQDRLIQTEKLASLGQLTAGIAHEIKNPLNFVNNFAALSAELLDEMRGVLSDIGLDKNRREELGEITQTLKSNLDKVVQHGKRADSIVKNMLLHSREGSGERRSADINALVGESLNLAYHGARAEKPGFAITLAHDLDPNAGALDLYPQEITRALLNLISNGFYAATRRKAESGDENFEPVLSAATRDLGETVEIRIRDNGMGIPPEVRAKIFNPFFTTKPTGEGTGLGLSMTHDIIVKQHGGRIDVDTEPGAFTEFIVTLPRDNGTGASGKPEWLFLAHRPQRSSSFSYLSRNTKAGSCRSPSC